MADVGNSGGPLFLVGSMGSGTTLLRLVLDSHENIAIAQETGFMRSLLAQKQVPFWKFGGDWYARLGWEPKAFDQELAAFYGRIFSTWASGQGAQRWGDKTPYHTWHIAEAAQVFPDATFIATVRHPGAVATSVHDRFKYEWKRSINHWVRSNIELVTRGRALGSRFILVRYEDLVLSTEATLRELLAVIGEPWSDNVLAHHEVHAQRGTAKRVEGRTRSDEPIDVDRISAWATTVDDSTQRLLRDATYDLAMFFGYDLAEPDRFSAFGGGSHGHILDGDDLAVRCEAFAGRIDFSRRTKPSPPNRRLTPAVLAELEGTAPTRPGQGLARMPGATLAAGARRIKRHRPRED